MALHDLGREDESASVLQELIDLENDNYAEIMAEEPDFVPWPFGFAQLIEKCQSTHLFTRVRF